MESLEGGCIIRMGWDKTHCFYSKFMATHIKKVLTAFQCTRDSLDYCFSHLNVHQSHLRVGALFEHRWLDLGESFWSRRSRAGPKNLHLWQVLRWYWCCGSQDHTLGTTTLDHSLTLAVLDHTIGLFSFLFKHLPPLPTWSSISTDTSTDTAHFIETTLPLPPSHLTWYLYTLVSFPSLCMSCHAPIEGQSLHLCTRPHLSLIQEYHSKKC